VRLLSPEVEGSVRLVLREMVVSVTPATSDNFIPPRAYVVSFFGTDSQSLQYVELGTEVVPLQLSDIEG